MIAVFSPSNVESISYPVIGPSIHVNTVMTYWASHVRIQRGTGGPDTTPLKNHKTIGFLSNTGPDPLIITKLPSQQSMLGHHWPASETPFNGVSLAGRLWPALSAIWILFPLIKKNVVGVRWCLLFGDALYWKKKKSWTPSGKIFWIRACKWHQDFISWELAQKIGIGCPYAKSNNTELSK